MWQRNMEINTHKKLPPYPYNLQNGGAQMKIKRVKMIIMALGMCVLAACGTKQEADQGAESVTLTGVTRGTAAEVDDGDHTADDGDVPAAENEEPVYTDIACVGGPYGEITVGGHNGWSIEAAPVDSGKLSYGLYGLILKPENARKGRSRCSVWTVLEYAEPDWRPKRSPLRDIRLIWGLLMNMSIGIIY